MIQSIIYTLREYKDDRKTVLKRQQIIQDLYNRLDRVRPSGENIAHEAHTTVLTDNFQFYEKLNKKVGEFQMESRLLARFFY